MAIGSPDYETSVTSQNSSEPSIEELVASAESRLKTEPDDLRGWQVLAPVYLRMGRYDEARNAAENIVRLDGRSTQNLMQLVEMMAAQANGRFTEEAVSLLEEIREDDPNNPDAGYLLSIAAYQSGNLEQARLILNGMIDNAQGHEAWLPTIKQRLVELDAVKGSEPEFTSEQMEMVRGMVQGLANRLASDPLDREGWARLIRAYTVLGETGEAQAAFENASKAFGNDKEYLGLLQRILEGAPQQ